MAAEKGNKYWIRRKKHGRSKNIKSPQELWELACDYFQWCDDNPLYEYRAFAYQGEISQDGIPKLRAYTWDGFEDYLFSKGVINDIGDYKYNRDNRYDDFITIITRIDKVIRNQKFQGAAADLLNANIIARDLGLSDKKELTGAEGGPIQVEGSAFTFEKPKKEDEG